MNINVLLDSAIIVIPKHVSLLPFQLLVEGLLHLQMQLGDQVVTIPFGTR